MFFQLTRKIVLCSLEHYNVSRFLCLFVTKKLSNYVVVSQCDFGLLNLIIILNDDRPDIFCMHNNQIYQVLQTLPHMQTLFLFSPGQNGHRALQLVRKNVVDVPSGQPGVTLSFPCVVYIHSQRVPKIALYYWPVQCLV